MLAAAASVSGTSITVPAAAIFGGALYFIVKYERGLPKLPIVIAVLFGATASATVLALFNAVLGAVHKG